MDSHRQLFMACFNHHLLEKDFENSTFLETEKFIKLNLTPEDLTDKEVWKKIYIHKDLEGISLGFLFSFFYFTKRFLISDDYEEISHWVFNRQANTLPNRGEILSHLICRTMTRN